jgi:hypothetical protein
MDEWVRPQGAFHGWSARVAELSKIDAASDLDHELRAMTVFFSPRQSVGWGFVLMGWIVD